MGTVPSSQSPASTASLGSPLTHRHLDEEYGSASNHSAYRSSPLAQAYTHQQRESLDMNHSLRHIQKPSSVEMKDALLQLLKTEDVQNHLKSFITFGQDEHSSLNNSRANMLVLEDKIDTLETNSQKMRQYVDESIERVFARMKVHVDNLHHEIRHMDQKREDAVEDVKKLIISLVSEVTENKFKSNIQRIMEVKRDLMALHDDFHSSSERASTFKGSTNEALQELMQQLRDIQRTVSENVVGIQEIRDQSVPPPMKLSDATGDEPQGLREQNSLAEQQYSVLTEMVEALKKEHDSSIQKIQQMEKEIVNLSTQQTPLEVKSFTSQLKDVSDSNAVSDDDETLASPSGSSILPNRFKRQRSPGRNTNQRTDTRTRKRTDAPVSPRIRLQELEHQNGELFRQIQRLTHDYQIKIAKCDAEIQNLRNVVQTLGTKGKATANATHKVNKSKELVEELKGVRSFLLDETLSEDLNPATNLRSEVEAIVRSMKVARMATLDKQLRFVKIELDQRLQEASGAMEKDQSTVRETLTTLHQRVSSISENIGSLSGEISTIKKQMERLAS
eukprot:CAMPEP_0117437560 /NCGR_PEP_ID=MMETSP0759-20121206/1586_1 /TAXON_ID=63605 /ORGANISM="Percolomonas cosmopolitus, Strain WS" /LENGTH=560 /DNA_ID=CAMNT_0005229195 /DNA_START=101 /DNA_END=1786 /DNA_ORIENTATION=-